MNRHGQSAQVIIFLLSAFMQAYAASEHLQVCQLAQEEAGIFDQDMAIELTWSPLSQPLPSENSTTAAWARVCAHFNTTISATVPVSDDNASHRSRSSLSFSRYLDQHVKHTTYVVRSWHQLAKTAALGLFGSFRNVAYPFSHAVSSNSRQWIFASQAARQNTTCELWGEGTFNTRIMGEHVFDLDDLPSNGESTS